MAVTSLHPLTIGELLDQAIRLYRKHFVTFIGIIAIVQIPFTLIQLAIGFISTQSFRNMSAASSSDPYSSLASLWVIQGLSLIITIAELILVQGIGSAALTRSIADGYLGRETGITEAYRRVGPLWPKVIGALLLLGICTIAAGFWTAIPCIGWFTGFGMILFLAACVRPMLIPITVLEPLSATAALRRAWDLAKRRFWWLLGFMVILWLFAWLIVSGPSLLVSFLVNIVLGTNNFTALTSQGLLLSTVLNALLGLLGSLIYLPLQLSACTLVYFDLRVRTEGFDLSMLSAASGAAPSGAVVNDADITQTAPIAANSPFITQHDMGNFLGISIIGIVIYFFLIGIVVLFSGIVFANYR